MRTILIILAAFIFLPSQAQELKLKKTQSGVLSLGARSSIGLVNDGQWQKPAFGTGGHFRLRFSDRVNSEWFADHLKADLSYYAWRADTHIGWSVMYYLTKNPEPLIQPYLLAGHCFEYLKFTDNKSPANHAERWSASIQAGIGTHFNITKRFDISIATQYMLHLGTKIKASNVEGVTSFTKTKGAGIHDHILLNLSINYKIADLW
ncbi:MAG TPA: hypothetical protein PKI01_12285 [Bacteroidales bacterium]|nr:hypothetical protein [Bacteroidales bacterium]